MFIKKIIRFRLSRYEFKECNWSDENGCLTSNFVYVVGLRWKRNNLSWLEPQMELLSVVKCWKQIKQKFAVDSFAFDSRLTSHTDVLSIVAKFSLRLSLFRVAYAFGRIQVQRLYTCRFRTNLVSLYGNKNAQSAVLISLWKVNHAYLLSNEVTLHKGKKQVWDVLSTNTKNIDHECRLSWLKTKKVNLKSSWRTI